VGVDDSTCCEKTCEQYQDKCTGDYAPNPALNNIAGNTANVCCKKTCALFSCNAGQIKPNAKEIIDASEDACCEAAECAVFRGKKVIEGGCNGLDKEKCAASKLELKNTDTNKTDELACTWRGDYGICSVGKPKPLSCSE